MTVTTGGWIVACVVAAVACAIALWTRHDYRPDDPLRERRQ